MKALFQFFHRNKSFTAFGIFILAVLLWMPSFLSGQRIIPDSYPGSMILYELLQSFFEDYITLSKIFAFLILILTSVSLNYLNTRFILVNERSFLPSYFFIVLTSFFPELQDMNPVLPATLCFLIAIHLLFSTYKAEEDTYRFFDTGLIIGLGSLFYAPLLWFIIFIWTATFIMRPFRWREWLYPVLGIIIPYIFLWGYYYIFLEDAIRIFRELGQNLYPVFGVPEMNLINIVVFLYIFLVLIISSIFMIKVYQFRKVSVKVYFQIFFWLFIISLVFYFFPTGADTGATFLYVIPLAYLVTNYFIEARKSFGNRLLFLLGLLIVILVQINEFFGIL